MKLPRASMTTTLVILLVLAIEIGIARDLLGHDRGVISVYGLGLLPVVTALALGLYRLFRLGGRSDAFTIGAEAAGLASTGVYVSAIQWSPALASLLNRVYDGLDGWILNTFPALWEFETMGLDEWISVALVLSVPPLLVALAAGGIAHRRDLARASARPRPRPRAAFRPRFTLGTTAVLVALLAVDFASIRQVLVHGGSPWGTFTIGFLPMANVLMLALPRALRGRGRFVRGFEIAGGLAMAAFLTACLVSPGPMVNRIGMFAEVVIVILDHALGGRLLGLGTAAPHVGVAFEVALVAAFFSGPPLVVALSGGALTRKFARTTA